MFSRFFQDFSRITVKSHEISARISLQKSCLCRLDIGNWSNIKQTWGQIFSIWRKQHCGSLSTIKFCADWSREVSQESSWKISVVHTTKFGDRSYFYLRKKMFLENMCVCGVFVVYNLHVFPSSIIVRKMLYKLDTRDSFYHQIMLKFSIFRIFQKLFIKLKTRNRWKISIKRNHLATTLSLDVMSSATF
jgi:hypothetical protein